MVEKINNESKRRESRRPDEPPVGELSSFQKLSHSSSSAGKPQPIRYSSVQRFNIFPLLSFVPNAIMTLSHLKLRNGCHVIFVSLSSMNVDKSCGMGLNKPGVKWCGWKGVVCLTWGMEVLHPSSATSPCPDPAPTTIVWWNSIKSSPTWFQKIILKVLTLFVVVDAEVVIFPLRINK